MIETIRAPRLISEATHCSVCGQRAAGAAAGDGNREGLGALVALAGAAGFPPAGGVEGLVEGKCRPALGNGGQVDRADGQGVGGAGVAQGAARGGLKDQVEAAGRGGVGRGVPGRAAGAGGGQPGQRGVAGVHGYRPAPAWPSDGIAWQRLWSSPWQQDKRQGRRAVWPVVWLARTRACGGSGWTAGWCAAGSSCTAGQRRRGAGQCWPVATLAAAVMSWMNCPAKPRRPGWRGMGLRT